MPPFLVPYGATRIPYWAAKSRSSDALFDDAMTEFRHGQYADAAAALEKALIKGDLDATHWQYVFYYLGLSYEQLGKTELGAAALQRFIEKSNAFGRDRYEVAEQRLVRLGGRMPPCRSQEPFKMNWKDGG